MEMLYSKFSLLSFFIALVPVFISMPISILYPVTVFNLFHWVIEVYKLPLKNIQDLSNNLAFSLQI